MYFKDEEGNDWNDVYSDLKNKFKFTYETDTGIIRSVCEEAGLLFVSGLSVADTATLPDNFDILGGWIYTGKDIIRNISFLKNNAEAKRNKLLIDVEDRIKLLERALRLGVATDDNKKALNELETYSILLSRIDTSTAPDIVWPKSPE